MTYDPSWTPGVRAIATAIVHGNRAPARGPPKRPVTWSQANVMSGKYSVTMSCRAFPSDGA